MQNALETFLGRNYYSSFIITALKGISQVLFIENAVSGMIILFGIAIYSPELALIAFASSLLGTLIGYYGGADEILVRKGIFGFNSVLTGVAVLVFMQGDLRWLLAITGAVAAAILTAGLIEIGKAFNLPVLTFPFIMITWFLLLSSYRLKAFNLSPDLSPQSLSSWHFEIEGQPEVFEGLFKGISEVFLFDYFWSGVFILAGIFWAGWRYGLFTVLGTGTAWLIAYSLGADIKLVNMGLYSYNAILTVIAVGFTYSPHKRTIPFAGLLAAVITVPVTASIDTWLLPFGLPTLSMPFVLCSWLFISARRMLPDL
ncbi:urea transporter [Lederbergia citrea]|uniref:Urea transporter n=1 Tax=Lederbergia citrea TaxID=2833581 RepID=A0A942Z5I9_9BACI|nr:urea transporter [Lederbergia citrea]MBS4178491.1 urea transporter [Lederbergia citrea]MBS4205162.1 urea transporter [Lederbergia citrea]MBS4222976.1 urea transporter [Lederbergia citrea]